MRNQARVKCETSALNERMGRVRSAARYVFRKHPSVLREATSAYERRKRSLNRRKKADAGKPGDEGEAGG